eukprot:7280969-Prymnesium_polylepis.1
MHEALSPKHTPLHIPLRVVRRSGLRRTLARVRAVRERELLIRARRVLRGHSQLENLEAVGSLEHAVSNGGRLDHQVARGQHKRLALALVHQSRPPGKTVYALEAHQVKMRVVGHRSTGRDLDLRRDHRATEAARDQVA